MELLMIMGDVITSGLDGIIDRLPQHQVHALLALLEAVKSVTDEEFSRRLSEAPEEDVDEETVASVLAAEAKQGEIVAQDELKRRLRLWSVSHY
jgi:hypothetical protein